MTTMPTHTEVLARHGLALNERVAVELLVTGPPFPNGPRTVEGVVVDATSAVLVLEHLGDGTAIRVPWAAIALIRTASSHPAL